MKRNLALLLAGILIISPVSAGIDVYADTNITPAAAAEETSVQNTENAVAETQIPASSAEPAAEDNGLKDGGLAEVVDGPSAEITQDAVNESAGTPETDPGENKADEALFALAMKGPYSETEASAEDAALIKGSETEPGTVILPDTVVEISVKEKARFSIVPKEAGDNAAKVSVGTPADILWECSDPEVAVLDENGILTACKEGEASISVSFSVKDVSYSIAFLLKVNPTVTVTTETVDTPAEETAGEKSDDVSDTISAEVSMEQSVEQADNSLLTADIPVPEGELQLAEDTGVMAAAAVTEGWVIKNSSWYYVQTDGKNVTGFKEINGKTYYFSSDGVMKTGWVYTGGKWYYFNPASGDMATGWKQVSGLWYYLDPDNNGIMEENTVLTLSGKHYFISSSGALQTGGWYSLNGVYYYANVYGILQTGWIKQDNKWYYLDPDNKGALVTGLINCDETYYISDNYGVLQVNKWVQSGGSRYYVNGYGVVQTGWIKQGTNNWYYLDPAQKGACLTGLQTVGKTTYFFDSNGLMQISKWVKSGDDYYYVNGYGIIQTGWQLISNQWYCLEDTGKLKTNTWIEYDSHWYFVGSDGVMARNKFVTSGSQKYYLDSYGILLTSSWVNTGGKWYYVNEWGVMQTGTVNINGTNYEFNSDGSWIVSTASYSNRQEFIALMAQLVRKYAPQWGVKVYSPIIAQAILESAYGESSLGKKYNNFFGLKCGTLWTGKSVSLKTGEEYSPGSYTTITANFRVYDSIEEGVRGYFVFLFDGRTRYNNLIGVTDPQTYLQNIKNDGYATSSKYVTNCMNVIKQYNLTQYDY